MKNLRSALYLAIGLFAGFLLGTWLFMLCFGPFGFLFPISDSLAPATLARLDALPGPPLSFAMLAVGLLLSRWIWRHAPASRWSVVTAALLSGIPSALWILLVIVMGQAIPNFGFGG